MQHVVLHRARGTRQRFADQCPGTPVPSHPFSAVG